MTEPLKLDRTWLCSVVFLDIVQYSRQSLEVQTRWKQRFNEVLADAIKDCPESDRVILDTGDGAAICFLGDPETAMFCALRLVTGIGQEKSPPGPALRVRAGINLGSVKLVKDINGNLNAVGDGINVSQRVMSFAAENQILVSRSFYEVASSISESYAGLFKYEGVRTDKHVREHTLYELHPPDPGRATLADDTAAAPPTVALTEGQILRLENELTGIIGPIAPHLVRKAIQHSENAADLRQALLGFVPSNPERGKFLGACRDIFPAGAAESAAPPAGALPPPPESPAWEPAVLEQAREDLAAHIGPMARLLVDRAAARTKTRAALYQLLAAEIHSAKDREDFLKRAA
ncbi:MAG: adenylate/guanylate cyclase domain-containing protein [Verrucomicrobiota bacterium]|jgi:class 3 adenylate cyclase